MVLYHKNGAIRGKRASKKETYYRMRSFCMTERDKTEIKMVSEEINDLTLLCGHEDTTDEELST